MVLSAAPRRLDWRDAPLAELAMPRGTMRLTRSLTSGLTWRAGDPPGVFWGVGDRGPNIKPADAVKRYGLDSVAALAVIEGAKIMPLPAAGPMLARFRLDGGAVVLESAVPLRLPDGTLLGGLPPALAAGVEGEPVFDADGSALIGDPPGADCEGIAARPDGRFWIAEEYGPSLLLVREDGVIERRIVPQGMGGLFGTPSLPAEDLLPPLAAARKLNRGFEGLALSPDGRLLYAAFQSPLAHPDREAHEQGDVVRIWALDAQTAEFRAAFAYPLDPSASFVRDCAAGRVEPSDVKVSELVACADGSLLVLERITLSTHIYRVWPEPGLALAPQLNDPAHRPTLEQLGQAGVAALVKQRVFSTDDHPAICGDLEGMLLLDDGQLLLANDSDYGIEGAETQFWTVPPLSP